MARNPEYTRPISDSTTFWVVQGDGQDIFPAKAELVKP